MLKTTAKPAGTNWTDEQWKAISGRGANLLVAAAAGSGKTAVLVERIIRLISEGDEPLDVDRLLVATFTKAAADEMRQRIREALESKLAEQPESDHLRRQLAYIHRASITTLHSFCLEVVRAHYQAIDLDPSFRIANETEIDLLRQDVLEELFEDRYATSEQDSDFWRLIDAYSGERSDEPLYRLVAELYDFSRSHPWPDYWLEEMAGAFALNLEEGSPDRPPRLWLNILQKDATLELKSILSLLEDALNIARLPSGPAPYAETLLGDIHPLQEAVHAGEQQTWEELYLAVQQVVFGKLKPCRKDDVLDVRLQEQVKELRDAAKKQFAQLQEECFQRSPQQFAEECSTLAPLMRSLIELVKEFSQRYAKAKKERGIVDFSDLEHHCLAILRGPGATPDRMVPSSVAEDYQLQFEEVLLDEYQDTNLVQEAIVSLISRASPGNRFMVGDVKQSIYRFRLAEPGLFLQKYKSYLSEKLRSAEGTDHKPINASSVDDEPSIKQLEGARIDLARNFRSRQEVVEGVNYIFKQIMNEAVGEMEYDEQAQLVYGANYPHSMDTPADEYAVEFTMLDRSNAGDALETDQPLASDIEETAETDNTDAADMSEAELQTAQLEARWIALQIRRLLGGEERGQPFHVFDRKFDGHRPATYSDIVILLRATQQWAPVIIEELRLAGIPAYAELSTGYFSAGEIEIMMSLLRVIDNPFQDIPLAAVLRSPIVRLSEDDLAQIRIGSRNTTFYEAVKHYIAANEEGNELRDKLAHFIEQLELWRNEARQSSVADLIWRIYRLTGWFDLVGGMPGGVQRQANLRALYDRARAYEKTSYRGLFRFLRFIERMRDVGGDLGTAGAIGEQEDVVRIMSIHKSKGLEFPIVFVAGLAKRFNQQDLNGSFLLHKELGFGPKLIDPELRVSYPSLPNIVIRRRMRLEMLAEEMRVLYVALTRAKEKLFLVGTVSDATRQAEKWASAASSSETALSDALLARARCYLDWIGPALMRHPRMTGLRELAGIESFTLSPAIRESKSKWNASVFQTQPLVEAAAARQARDETIMEALYRGEPVFHLYSEASEEIEDRLKWAYPYAQASSFFSKTSVSEMKRKNSPFGTELEETEAATIDLALPRAGMSFEKPLLRRPRFLEQEVMSATERGTIVHALMQHINFQKAIHAGGFEAELARLTEQGLMTQAELEHIDLKFVAAFFHTELAERIVASPLVKREVPFSYGIKASEAYPDASGNIADEPILVQGVIDCIFEEADGLVLVDYKTDAVRSPSALADIKDRYTLQIQLYTRAIQDIWRKPVKEAYLYLFNGGHVLEMKTNQTERATDL